MASLGELGIANVGIRADGKRLQGDLNKARGMVINAGKKSGTLYAQEFGKSATSGLKTALAGLVSVVAIKQLGAAFLRAALPFNAALAETSTLIEGTVEQTEFLRDTARKLAKEFGGTGTAQVQAFYQAISAGAGTVEEAASLLDTANKLAIGGVTDLVTAVDVLTTATNAYSTSGLNAADASDILFVGVKAGKTTMGELGDAIGRVASFAADAGLGFDELVAAVAALTTTGISTREAVTGVRAILSSLIKPSAEAAKEAERLGLNFSVAGLEARGLEGFLDDLAKATGGSVESLGKLFTGSEALVPVISLLGAVNDKLGDTMVDMANRVGAADIAFQKVRKELSARLIVAMGKFNVASEIAGTKLLKVLVPALELVADNMVAMGKILIVIAATQIPRMITAMVSLVSVVGDLSRGIRLLGGPLGILAGLAAAATLKLLDMDRGAKDAADGIARLDAALNDTKRAMSDLEGVQTSLKGDTERLKTANERLTTAIEAGGVAAIGTAAAEVQSIKKRLASNEALRLKYLAVLEAQKLALKAEQQLAAAAFREEFTPDDRGATGGFARRANIGRSAENRVDFSREAISKRRAAALDEVRIAAREAAEQGKATDEQLQFLKADAALAERTLQVEELGSAIENLGSSAEDVPPVKPIKPAGTGTGTGTGTDAEATAFDNLSDSINQAITAEKNAQQVILATAESLGMEDAAREKLLDTLEAEQSARALLNEIAKAGADLKPEEIVLLKELKIKLDEVTAARIDQTAQLREQADAVEEAERRNLEMVDSIDLLGDSLVRAIDDGKGFIGILETLALQILSMPSFQDNLFAGITGEGGGAGGIGGNLGTFIGSLFPASGGGGGGGAAAALAAALGPGSQRGLAHGGVPKLGSFSLVGERGPELQMFDTPSRIFSNKDLQDVLGSRGDNVTTINQTNQFLDATGAREAAGSVARRTAELTGRGSRYL